MDLITQFRTMAQYNTVMNRSIYDACGALSDVERKRDVHAFFGSIHRTLNHLLLTDREQMGRFVGADRMRSLDDSGREIEIRSLDQELYADFATLRRERKRPTARSKHGQHQTKSRLNSLRARCRTTRCQRQAGTLCRCGSQ